MKETYLFRLQRIYNKKSFQRKLEYIKYNFGPIIERLKSRKDISVLEVGPGLGEFIKYLNSVGVKDIDVIDNDRNVLKNLKIKFSISNSYFSDNVISVKNKLRKYDLIVLIQVLEHISPKIYFSAVKVLYSKLKKKGTILMVVPNANNPLGSVERYGDLQHQMAFTSQSLKDLVMGSGITNYNVEIRGYSIPPYTLINLIRILLQKTLHLILLGLMIVNGGSYFKVMTPNLTLIIEKEP